MSQPEFQSVIVIGAGLIGTASAYALTKSGFQVTLVEASEAPAMGASFANGGMITPSMSDPWNGPGIGGHILSAFFNPDSGMRVHPRAISSLLGWGVRFILNSSPRHFRQATRSNFFLANYSLSVTKAWRQELDLGYDAVDRGTLKVFATQDAMAGPLQIAQDLSPDGLQYQVLDMQEILAMQPALAAVKDRIAGAIYYPDDSVGNARLFTCELQSRAQALGCKVHFNTQVTSIAPQDSRVTVVARSGQALHADCLVVAAAIDSLDLLDPLGLHIPIRPAKGYSVSFPVAPDHLPRYAVVDDARHIAVTPIGDQLRVVGTAEFVGRDTSVSEQRIRMLLRCFKDLYPQLYEKVDLDKAQRWAGLRPMSVDGKPFIGATQIPRVFLNTGHGHLGWTMAAGSAELLASHLRGDQPPVNPEDYAATRITHRQIDT